MQFSITAHTKVDNWDLYPYIEDLGFDAAWVPDSQMIWSDCYATLALAAQHTSAPAYWYRGSLFRGRGLPR